jgi:hypothetical protein
MLHAARDRVTGRVLVGVNRELVLEDAARIEAGEVPVVVLREVYDRRLVRRGSMSTRNSLTLVSEYVTVLLSAPG